MKNELNEDTTDQALLSTGNGKQNEGDLVNSKPNGPSTIVMPVPRQLGPSSKVISDKSEYLKHPTLLSPVSTTDIDKNPVLSDIAIPRNMKIDSRNSAKATLTSNTPAATDLLSKSSITANSDAVVPDVSREPPLSCASAPTVSRQSKSQSSLTDTKDPDPVAKDAIPMLTPIILNDGDPVNQGHPKGSDSKTAASLSTPGRSITFSLSNSIKQQRSSIYASKSTATAIPIPNSNNNRGNNNINSSSISGNSIGKSGYLQSSSPHYTNLTVGQKQLYANAENDAYSIRSRSSSVATSISRSFLFGFYNNQKNSKKMNNNIISKEYWMKDESVKDCFSCGKTFNTFRRRHHCRICGQIFCYACTLLIAGDRFGYAGKMRVCHDCYEQSNNYEDSSEEEDDLRGNTTEAVELNGDFVGTDGDDVDYRVMEENNDPLNSRRSSIFPIDDSIGSLGNGSESRWSVDASNAPLVAAGKLNEVTAFNEHDDSQSIFTTGEDSKFFISTPPPLPPMAIPATKHGESLEISFKNSKNLNKYNVSKFLDTGVSSHLPAHSKSSLNVGSGVSYDRYTLKNVDMLPNSLTTSSSGRIKRTNPGLVSDQHSGRNTQNQKDLRRSIFNYVSNAKKIPSSATGGGRVRSFGNPDPPMSPTSTIIGNLASRNFKFQFNYGKRKNQSQENENIDESDSSSTEDEGTMSIYSSLNDVLKSDNPIRSTRNSTHSFQRAQQSLQRIKERRKGRGRNHANVVDSIYRGIDSLTHSTPNLLTVVSEDTQIEFLDANTPKKKSETSLLSTRSDGGDIDVLSAAPDETNSPTLNLTSGNEVDSPLEVPVTGTHLTLPKQVGGKYNFTNQWRRLSSLKKQTHDKSELNDVAMMHLKRLLIQVLNDQNLENTDKWFDILKKISIESLQQIVLSARDSNTLDYRQKYVKIKRISGGNVKQSTFVNGIVFSKALPCKSMPRRLENPRILLVMFPLEYQKNGNHFLSLDSVFSQEREYLDKLISRLTSLRPDIVLVGANVSGYALDLLKKSDIIVQYNIKPQVIERVSRMTEADIAVSIDNLASNIKLGECGLFEVRTFIYGNISKTYTFLDGCKPTLGGTILLRGDTADNLRKIKHVAEFLVYLVFSLKLESSFFSDNFIQLSTDFYLKQQEEKRELAASVTGYFADFLNKFYSRILTVSPTVEYPIPFLLKKARFFEEKILEKTREYQALEDNPENSKYNDVKGLGIESTLTIQDMKYVSKFLREKSIEELQELFKRRSRQWELSYSLSNNLLGTGSHQSITVLYSMVSTRTATPCIGPQIVTIDYFWDSDVSLGQFIENVVTTAWCPCQQGCDGLFFDHYRSYVHGSGKVDVILEKFQTKLPRLKNIILTWSFCKKCGTSTPVLQLSDKTWNHSFGKFLEVMFWSKEGSLSGVGNCTHDFTKDHVKYFGYNDLVLRIEYSDLEIYELVTPPPKIQWKPNTDIKMKVELYYGILDKINAFYTSVINRLDRIKLDSVSGDRLVEGENKIAELRKRVNDEKKQIIADLETLYHETPGDNHLQMNFIIKKLYNNSANWDSEFSSFGTRYLPSENDISRITTRQLKKLFTSSKQDEQSKSVSDDLEKVEKIDEESVVDDEEKVDNDACDKEKQEESERDDKVEYSPEIPVGGNGHELPSDGSLSEKVDRQEGLHTASAAQETTVDHVNGGPLESSEHNVQPAADRASVRSVPAVSSNGLSALTPIRVAGPKRHISPPLRNTGEILESRVAKLASFFDQIHLDAISKEFELQRKLERKKLNKADHPANKFRSLEPIVEIYKDVKDAVDEPLHDSKKQDDMVSVTTNVGVPKETEHSSIDIRGNEDLENELENSITQWSEDILHERESDKTQAVKKTKKSAMPVKEKSETATAHQPTTTKPPAKAQVKEDTNTQPEKSLLMKALTNFWADRSPYLWKPLEYPVSAGEHFFPDSNVIVRDEEPSSLIAFCLSTNDYKSRISSMEAHLQMQQQQQQQQLLSSVSLQRSNEAEGSTPQGRVLATDKEPQQQDNPLTSTTSAATTSSVAATTTASTDIGSQKVQHSVSGSIPSAASFKTAINDPVNLESIMTKKTAVHLRYQFEDGMTVMSCKIFFAEHFDAFRRICNCSDNFIQSLSRCVKWDSSGGKSGSGFLKTLDDRFIVKELSHSELDAFIKFAPSYFEYMAQALFHDLPTTLAKVFGFYQIQVKNSLYGSKNYKMDVLIMENLFYEKKTSRIFDLKGSMRNRHVEQTGKENEVLLDENMVEYIYESPIHVREYDKKLLRASLWNDTLFLAKMNVMDYSLVVGIDSDHNTLIVGIIDFLRTYTWDKKLESWVKEKGLVGGGSSTTMQPTVVTPRQYKNRFREAMERYILVVPDPWYQDPD